MFSLHLAEVPPDVAARAMLRPPTGATQPGLRHLEGLAAMRLGAPVVSVHRFQLHRLAVIARWEDETALDDFLVGHRLGRRLAEGWHVRLEYLRRWSGLAALPDLPARAGGWSADEPVVAITVARMRLARLPRFLRWGRPVEQLVRDHPDVTLALAGLRPPRTVATFSVWRSVAAMESMVRGTSPVPDPRRHVVADAERRRRDFHHEFATFRFRPLSEHGTWQGRAGIVPTAPAGS